MINIDFEGLGGLSLPNLPSTEGITFGNLGGSAIQPGNQDSTFGHVAFENMDAPTPHDLLQLAMPGVSESFELKDGKIVPKYVPLRDRIKNPAGRTDYGWDHNMRRRHLTSSYARGWREFPYRFRAHDGVLHIVGGGPSLKDNIKALRRYSKKPKNFILSLNKTHDFLLNLPRLGYGPAIKSWGAALLDPCDWVKDYITPQPGVQYLIGDQCAPATFDVFEKPGITKWIYRATNPEKDKDIVPQDMHFIFGGSTVGMRMRCVGYLMGFREIHYWGFDSSAEISKERPDGKMHGYEKVESVRDRVSVKAIDEGGFEREFISNTHMARQAQEYIEIRDEWVRFFKEGKCEWIYETFHGDGLLPTIAARLGLHSDPKRNIAATVPLIPGPSDPLLYANGTIKGGQLHHVT